MLYRLYRDMREEKDWNDYMDRWNERNPRDSFTSYGTSATPSTCGCSYSKDIQQEAIDTPDTNGQIVITIRIEKDGVLDEEITITR